MSTYTSSLGLELITPGSQAGLWGNTTNNTFNLIDQAITGVTPVSFAGASGSTYTLTDFNGAENEARSAVLNLTGTATGANTLVVPNKQKTYLVRNATSQDVTFQTASPTLTYTVGSGYSILIFCDGNNNVFTGIASPGVGTLSVNAGGTGVTSFTAGFVKSTGGANALTSASGVALGSEVTGTLPVANGGTGVTSFTSGAVVLGNGSGALATVTGSSSGQVLTWNGSNWAASGVVNSLTAGTGVTITGGSGGKGDLTISASGSAPVSSVFGRTGAVTAVSTDYSSYYGSLSGGNTWSGTNTFSSTVTSQSYNFASGVAIYYNGSQVAISVSGGGCFVDGSGNFTITGSTATKASGTTWANPSDSRLKDNVQDYTKGLSTLAQIQPKSWVFNGKGGSQAGTHGRGVIADQIASVLPDSVTTYKAKLNESDAAETDIKMFNADEIIWILVNSVKELKAEVDALKAAK